jgi:hypothetical protein
MVSFTPRPLYPQERPPGSHCIGVWMDPRTGLDHKKWKLSTLPGFELGPSVGQPIASRYTSCSLQFEQCVPCSSMYRSVVHPTSDTNVCLPGTRVRRIGQGQCRLESIHRSTNPSYPNPEYTTQHSKMSESRITLISARFWGFLEKSTNFGKLDVN